MKIFNETCWEVYDNHGRDCRIVAHASNEALAKELRTLPDGSLNPWRGVNRKTFNIVIFDTMEEVNQNSIEALRASAMAKLTQQEIAALVGFTR